MKNIILRIKYLDEIHRQAAAQTVVFISGSDRAEDGR